MAPQRFQLPLCGSLERLRGHVRHSHDAETRHVSLRAAWTYIIGFFLLLCAYFRGYLRFRCSSACACVWFVYLCVCVCVCVCVCTRVCVLCGFVMFVFAYFRILFTCGSPSRSPRSDRSPYCINYAQYGTAALYPNLHEPAQHDGTVACYPPIPNHNLNAWTMFSMMEPSPVLKKPLHSLIFVRRGCTSSIVAAPIGVWCVHVLVCCVVCVCARVCGASGRAGGCLCVCAFVCLVCAHACACLCVFACTCVLCFLREVVCARV